MIITLKKLEIVSFVNFHCHLGDSSWPARQWNFTHGPHYEIRRGHDDSIATIKSVANYLENKQGLPFLKITGTQNLKRAFQNMNLNNWNMVFTLIFQLATLQLNCRAAVLVGWPQNVAKTNFTFISSQKAVLLLNFGQNNHFLCDEVTSKVTYTFYNVYFQIEVSLFGCLHFEVN